MENIHKFNRFKYYSEKAAESEHQGDLQDAKEQWAIAELNAKDSKKLCDLNTAPPLTGMVVEIDSVIEGEEV